MNTMGGSRRCRQSGAAATEFAFVFPLLFLLIYGTVVYSYLFVLKESITYAAQAAAEAAVAVDLNQTTANRQAAIIAVARQKAVLTLNWLPQSQRQRVLGDDSGSKVTVNFGAADVAGLQTVNVALIFDVATGTPLFPVLNLPLVGEIPPLPDTLAVNAVALI